MNSVALSASISQPTSRQIGTSLLQRAAPAAHALPSTKNPHVVKEVPKPCSRGKVEILKAHLKHAASLSNIMGKCLKVPRSSVQTIIRKYKKDGNVQPSYRSGRKKVLCPRDERALVRSVHINPRAKAKDLVNMMAEAVAAWESQNNFQMT
ncbi:hypothetical protein NFI96_000287 [Prochilodus magdalenae]|nr:hypothetical protein NFI96_000287 [Prochilodus magdalenae]